jgi:hypothetical protein
MKASQLMAWLLCLVIAFLALLLAGRASLKTTVLEKRFAEVRQSASAQAELFKDLRDVLQRIDDRLSALPPSGRREQPPEGIERLRNRIADLEAELRALKGAASE